MSLTERFHNARLRADRGLVEFGAYVVHAHGNSWVRCESCDAFGDMRIAGVFRQSANSVHVVCKGCALERGLRMLPLLEAHTIAQRDKPKTDSVIAAL